MLCDILEVPKPKQVKNRVQNDLWRKTNQKSALNYVNYQKYTPFKKSQKSAPSYVLYLKCLLFSVLL